MLSFMYLNQGPKVCTTIPEICSARVSQQRYWNNRSNKKINLSNNLSSPRWNSCFVNEIHSERTQRIFGFIRAEWKKSKCRELLTFHFVLKFKRTPRTCLKRDQKNVSSVLLLMHIHFFCRSGAKNQSKFQAGKMLAALVILLPKVYIPH